MNILKGLLVIMLVMVALSGSGAFAEPVDPVARPDVDFIRTSTEGPIVAIQVSFHLEQQPDDIYVSLP